MALLLPIANEKGGCGKTTTTMNIAGGLQKAGYRVLVVDADPQGSSVAWSIAQGADTLPFHVMPGRHVRNLQQLAQSDEYDIILFDCPPGITGSKAATHLTDTEKLARNVLRIADAILVPLMPSTLDFTAAATLVRHLSQELDPRTKVLVLVNAVENTRLSRQAPAQAAVLFASIPQATILETRIGRRIAIAEVSGSGKTIFDYAPRQTAAREYTNLIKEIIQWLSRNAQTSASSHPSTTSAKSSGHSRRAA